MASKKVKALVAQLCIGVGSHSLFQGSFQSSNQTQVSLIADVFFTI